LSKLLRWDWNLEKSIATGTHNSEPRIVLSGAAPAVKREAANPAATMSSVMTTIGIVRVAFWRACGMTSPSGDDRIWCRLDQRRHQLVDLIVAGQETSRPSHAATAGIKRPNECPRTPACSFTIARVAGNASSQSQEIVACSARTGRCLAHRCKRDSTPLSNTQPSKGQRFAMFEVLNIV
jgi:hypothetical protein